MSRQCLAWVAGAGMMILGMPALGQILPPADMDVYKILPDGQAVPDVDKPFPLPALDESCWQAVAANLLGASGYGAGAGPGASAQQRADYIYQQLIVDLGFVNRGNPARAINYWLYTYGKNPASPQFDPHNARTDVTWFINPGGLTNAHYDFLLDELQRCQYVGVTWHDPAHAMTLIGGNKSNVAAPRPSVSVWHDSDKDRGNGPNPLNDDQYQNVFGPPDAVWHLDDPVTPGTDFNTAQEYVTLCPGLNKPERAMVNYDVAYYLTDANDKDGVWTPTFREAGLQATKYADPFWVPDSFRVRIGNELIPNLHKEISLLVDYTDRVQGRELLELVQLIDDQGNLWAPTSILPSLDNGQLLFTWILDRQPGFEFLVFPDKRYQNLQGNVKDWDVATICVPEPMTLLLLGPMGLMLLGRRARP